MIINKSEVFYVFPDEGIEGKKLYPPRETWEIYVKFLENFNPTKIWQYGKIVRVVLACLHIV